MSSELLKGIKKVLEVFSKEYKEETKYREFMKQNVDSLKQSNKESVDEESVDEKVKRLINKDYKSNFKINIGSYE